MRQRKAQQTIHIYRDGQSAPLRTRQCYRATVAEAADVAEHVAWMWQVRLGCPAREIEWAVTETTIGAPAPRLVARGRLSGAEVESVSPAGAPVVVAAD